MKTYLQSFILLTSTRSSAATFRKEPLQSLGYYLPITDNQLEKKMEHEMDTGDIQFFTAAPTHNWDPSICT